MSGYIATFRMGNNEWSEDISNQKHYSEPMDFNEAWEVAECIAEEYNESTNILPNKEVIDVIEIE